MHCILLMKYRIRSHDTGDVITIAVVVLFARTYSVSFGDIKGIETIGNIIGAADADADGELVGLSDGVLVVVVMLVDKHAR
jgi:hypothetical protein